MNNTVLNANKLSKAEELVNGLTNNSNVTIKRVKNDRGLIEKTESDKNKIILVEDNRQIICG
jgi:hypothetical protein